MKIDLEIEDRLLDSDVEITGLDSLLLAIVGGEGGLDRVVDVALDHGDGLETVIERADREELERKLSRQGLHAFDDDIPDLAASAVLECRHREMPPAVAKLLSKLTGAYVADEYPARTPEEDLQSSIWRKSA